MTESLGVAGGCNRSWRGRVGRREVRLASFMHAGLIWSGRADRSSMLCETQGYGDQRTDRPRPALSGGTLFSSRASLTTLTDFVSTSNRAAGPVGKRAACPRCAAKDVLLPLQLPMDETRSASFAVDAASAVRAASKLGTAVRSFLDGHGSPRLLYGASVIHCFR